MRFTAIITTFLLSVTAFADTIYLVVTSNNTSVNRQPIYYESGNAVNHLYIGTGSDDTKMFDPVWDPSTDLNYLGSGAFSLDRFVNGVYQPDGFVNIESNLLVLEKEGIPTSYQFSDAADTQYLEIENSLQFYALPVSNAGNAKYYIGFGDAPDNAIPIIIEYQIWENVIKRNRLGQEVKFPTLVTKTVMSLGVHRFFF
ncbi:hypothetical protein G210_2291 [Candida maltosa Xu316]|uniref:Uncharacterized protein n=1 Tax=Candida maltosa (strain Xu316) TaxID=1245528 RepID=M3J5N7_CANMX|nr:hypothetical protein G210_2291 [Candida maltosa Xu316]